MVLPFQHTFLGKFCPVFLLKSVAIILFITLCFKLTLALTSPLNILSSFLFLFPSIFWHLVLKHKNYWLLYSSIHTSCSSRLFNFSYLFICLALFFLILPFSYICSRYDFFSFERALQRWVLIAYILCKRLFSQSNLQRRDIKWWRNKFIKFSYFSKKKF